MNTAAMRTDAFSGSHCSRQPPCEDSAPNLTLAALKGDTGLVIELLKAGADPDARDGQGRTPLLEAAFGGHIDTLPKRVARSRRRSERERSRRLVAAHGSCIKGPVRSC
jgi:ankyrin repeat protein